ncbi:hypothetical protein EV363DRAFT_1159684, partial [Boletus edulis]
KTHSWRHDPSEYRQRALLVYQGRIRKDWHKTLGTTDAFCLLPINGGRLNDYHEELLDNAYVTRMEAIRTATHIYPSLSNQPPLMSAPCKQNHSRSSSFSKRPMSPSSSDHADVTQPKRPRYFHSSYFRSNS